MDTEGRSHPHPALTLAIALLGALTLPALVAAGPRPEIVRATGLPQAVGAVHTVRGIPEACTRLEGVFTGQAARPYRLTAVKTHVVCQPRARFADFARVQPSPAKGWQLNDLIRVPSAACPSLQAVVRVWRKPVAAAPSPPDAQGRARVYLDAGAQAATQATAKMTVYAAEMTLEGKACGG